MISLYSLIWTVLISCPLLLLIVVLRRRTACLMKYGVTFICILYAFCAIRMLIPIEVPVFQKVICDPHMFSFLMKTYADLGADKRRLALGAIFGIWVLGIIAWSIYYSITVGGLLIKLRRTCYKGDGRVERILEEIAPNSGISIRYTDLVDTPFLVGIFKPTIYMTEVECTDT